MTFLTCSAGTAIHAEARASDTNQEHNEVLVTIFVQVQQPDNTTQPSKLLVYVNCRDLDNDSAIIEKNHITFDGEPLSSTNQKILADYVRNIATPVCQRKQNGSGILKRVIFSAYLAPALHSAS